MAVRSTDDNRHLTETVDTFYHGANSDVDTTAEQLTASSVKLVHGLIVRANSENAGIIYVGLSGLTVGGADATEAWPLLAGEALKLEIDDPSKVYVMASIANQKVHWTGN